ncbi:MAG: F0F1 ATP synthase subunit A [Candidatus Omnitrophica bacterium]|nr:F0F1 ATP synthase subunit A [Candidatus Omnitrophota bacterium]
MSGTQESYPELPNIVHLLAECFPRSFFTFFDRFHHELFSLAVGVLLLTAAFFATRKTSLVPHSMQNAAEVFVQCVDDFVCSIIGPHGRTYTPFVGTVFIYILLMNLIGLIPFMVPATSGLSITLAISLVVFVYVQYTAISKQGLFGYLYHLAGKPKGILGVTVVLPLFMFCMHVITEFIRPLSLALRLRSVMWGDDILLAVIAGFGWVGLPLLVVNMGLALLTAVVQALVFTLLSTVYLSLAMGHDE